MIEADPAYTLGLDEYRRLFSQSRDLTQRPRLMAQVASRYYNGKNDPTLERTLRRKKQPDFNINLVRRSIDGMVGVVGRGKTDPRAYPRNPQDEDSSEVATDVLRYVADSNRWHQNKTKAFRNMLVEGVCAVLVEVNEKLDIKINRIRYEEFFYDPYSREPDFSDASYMGVAKWQYVDAIVAVYPEYEDQLRNACSSASPDSNFADKPNDGQTWVDSKRNRLLIVEMYRQTSGVWNKCVFVGDLKLEEGVSPYLDNDDQPCCPIEGQSAYVDEENFRYGEVHDMMGPQDEVNVYRRKAAHYATFRQLQETDPAAAGIDPEEARREAAKPDGVIPSGWGVVSNTDKFQMDQQLLQEAKAEIARIAPNPAILGRSTTDASGRAQLIRQQAGLTELDHLFGGLEDLELRMYRQVWGRARQFWTEEKYVRVTDDIEAFKFIHINQPIMEMKPVIDPATGIPQYDPMTRQIAMASQQVGVDNQIAQMEMDIIVDTTPDTANVQQEQYQGMVDLAKMYGPEVVPFDDLLQLSSLPRKRELLESRKAKASQSAQPDPQKQEAMQLAKQAQEADIAKTQSETAKNEASALKTVSDTRSQNLDTSYREAGFQ